MRLTSGSSSARPAPIDRNHTNQTKYSNTGAIAPHGGTTRWTYTVAAGKKATIQDLLSSIIRSSAAAPVGAAFNEYDYTPSGGALAIVSLRYMNTNGVNDNTDIHLTNLGDMDAGDTLAALDADASTGGTVTFVKSAKIFEYDA